MDIDFNDMAIRVFSIANALLFFSLSFFVVRSDIKTQKIPNKLILNYLKAGVVLYILMFLYGIAYNNNFVVNYVLVVIVNVLIAFVVGYAFWYFDLWSPGDGKYFPLVTMFVPLHTYTYQFVPHFPSMVILVNSYIIAFIILFLYTLFLMLKQFIELARSGFYSKEFFREVYGHAREKASEPMFYFRTVGTIFCVITLLLIIRSAFDVIHKYMHFTSGHAAVISILILFYVTRWFQEQIRKNQAILVTTYLAFAGVLLIQQFVMGVNLLDRLESVLITSFFMVVFIPFARKMIDHYQQVMETIKSEHVCMGVCLSQETVDFIREQKNIELPADVELTDEQAQMIKDNFPNTQRFQRSSRITFGPFIFLGALFNIVFARSIMHYL